VIPRAKGLLAAGRDVPGGWLAELAYPPLLDTTWNAVATAGFPRDVDPASVLVFVAAGQLEFVQPWAAYPGTWRQVGCAVELVVNGYSTFVGAVEGDCMRGRARNPDGLRWSWEATRLDE
jgi:hypothetical protein